jgi:hypothetical protein
MFDGIRPYPDRQVMLDHATPPVPWQLHHWVEMAMENRTPLATLEALADRYVPPPPRQPVVFGEPSGEAAQLKHLLEGDAYHAWRYGPKDGHDRSNSLARLCHKMHAQGIKPADAWVLLVDADQRWGKFYDRADGDDQLHRILEVAYG